jgi:uncharacterized SAM-binding protein YcdF (DUF218 family)
MFVAGALSILFFKMMASVLTSVVVSTPKIAIVIPGGGLTGDGQVHAHVEARVQEALQVYTKLKSRNPNLEVKLIPISGGTPHKPPPLDAAGFPITEAQGSAKRLLDLHVTPGDIMEEGFSLDTLGNAYFLRNTHIDPGRYTKMIVVTNEWHMDRTRGFFDTVFSLSPASTDSFLSSMFAASNNHVVDIEYRPVAPVLEGDALQSRRDREKASLKTFMEQTRHEFSSMEELHSFLFTKHKAYASSRLLQGHARLDPVVSATY